MATSKNSTTKVRFSAKTFASGLAKSTGSAVMVTLSSYAPFVSETASKIAENVSDTSKFIKENNPFKRSKNSNPTMRRIANDANDVFDNLKDDFVTGDMSFSGTKEILEQFKSKYSDDEWDFGDDNPFEDDPFAEDASTSAFTTKAYADGVYATATAITQSSRVSANAIIGHNYKAMKAMSNKMIASNMANFAKINMSINSTNNKLEAINNNIVSLVEFNNTTMNDYIKNMTEHIAKQQAFMDNMMQTMTAISDKVTGKRDTKSKIDPDEFNFVKGGFDPKKFLQNFFENSQYGNITKTGLSSIFKVLFGKTPKFIEGSFGSASLVDYIKNINPISIAIEALFPSLKDISKIDKDIEKLMRVFFAKAKEGTLGGVFGKDWLKSIMKEIGFSPDYFSKTLTSYDKEAMSWTGQDSMALQTVIPTYLADIDAGIKNMENSIVGAINSVTDTVALYGEIFRTGDKSLVHHESKGENITTKKFKKSNGDEVSVNVRDYSKNFNTKRKFERQLFDFKTGSFKTESEAITEKQEDVAMLFQSAFSDVLGNVSDIISKSKSGNAKKDALKDSILEKMLDFDMYDTPKTLKDAEVADITSKLKAVKSDITDKEITKFINDFNIARFDLAEKHMSFSNDNYDDSIIRVLQDKLYMGTDEGRASLINAFKDKNKDLIKFISFDDLMYERLSGKSAEERAKAEKERAEQEKVETKKKRALSGIRAVSDFLGITSENGDIVNEKITGGISHARDFISKVAGVINNIPQHASGAIDIERDKVVKVHKGEIILPPDTSEAVRDHIEKFIRGEVSEVDENITGKANAEILRHVLRNKNHKKISNVTIATREMWESDDTKNSKNVFEWFTYKIDEIGENIKIIGQNSLERIKEEAKKIDNDNANGINHNIVGEKNKNGYYEDGIASKVINRGVSAKNKAIHALYGTGYVDYDTDDIVYSDKKNSFIGKYKEFLKEQADSIATSFGLSSDDKKSVLDTVDFLAENTDKAIIGGAGSLIASALLGVSINPIIGAGAALALSHDKIKEKLFGTKDGLVNRKDDGLISPEKQKFIKDNIYKLITGGAVGAVGMKIARNSTLGSAVTGLVGGLTSNMMSLGGVGGIVGGILNTTASLAMSPLAGALIGVGGMALMQSEAVKKTLFGEETEINGKKVRQGGILGGLKKSFHKVTDAVVTAVVGEKYKETDDDGNEVTKRHGGIIGAVKNAVGVHVIEPLKETGSYIKDYFKLWFEYDVIGNIAHIVDPIRIRMEKFADSLMEGVKGVTNQMTEAIKDALSPLTTAVKGIGDALIQMTLGSIKGAVKMSLGIASAPLKTLAALMNIGNSRARLKAKITGIRYDIGIFKEEFKEFNDKLSTIWFGENYKENREKFVEKVKNFFDPNNSPIFTNIAKPIGEAMVTGFDKLAEKFKNSDFGQKIMKALDTMGGFFGKLGGKIGKAGKAAGKWISTNIFGGLGDRFLHPFKKAKEDFMSGYNDIEGFKSDVASKFANSKAGKKIISLNDKLLQTGNLFKSSFGNSKMIIRDKLGIGLGSTSSADQEESKKRLEKYLDDKYGFVDTQMLKDNLGLLEKSGIKTDQDRERYTMLRNELRSYDILQGRINKVKRQLGRKYGYNDDDFLSISPNEQERIRKKIAKASGIDTSEWTVKDIAKFAHGSIGDKKEDERKKKVEEATVQVPVIIESTRDAIIDSAEERHEVILEAIDNVSKTIENSIGAVIDNQNDVADRQEKSEEKRNEHREKVAKDKAKRKNDEEKIRQSQALGNAFDMPFTDSSDNVDEEDQGLFNSENYASDGKKEGLLSKIASIPMKLLGGAVSGVKGIFSFISGHALPIAIGLGATLAWPLLKKIPWDKIIGFIPKLLGTGLKYVVTGVGHVVTDVIPEVASAVITNIPEMVSAAWSGIVGGIQNIFEDAATKKTITDTIVNSNNQRVESDINKVGIGDVAAKFAQDEVVSQIDNAIIKKTVNNIAGEAATSASTLTMRTIGGKILEVITKFFTKSFEKKHPIIAELITKKIKPLFTKLLDKIKGKVAKTMEKVMATKAAKKGIKSFQSLMTLAPQIKVISVSWNAIWGAANVERIFHLEHSAWYDPGDSDIVMRTIAAVFNVIENDVPGLGILMSLFFDVIAAVAAINEELKALIGYDGDLRCRIATDIYVGIVNDDNKELKLKAAQVKFKDQVDAYNDTYGTNINTTQMAYSQNMYLSEMIFDSKSKIDPDWQNTATHSGDGFGIGDTGSISRNTASVGRGERFGDSVGYGHFVQNDPRWSRRSYGHFRSGRKSTIGSGGCGPTALANAINNVSGGAVTNPLRIANFASKNGYSVDGGTSAGLFNSGARSLGVTSKEIGKSGSSIKSQLKNGNNIIISGKGGSAFTPAGHIMTVKGVDRQGNAVVDDPLRRRSRHIPFRALTKGMTHAWSIGRGRRSIGYGLELDDGDNFALGREIFDTNNIPVYDPETGSYKTITQNELTDEGVRLSPNQYNGLIYGLNGATSAGCLLNSLMSGIFTKILKNFMSYDNFLYTLDSLRDDDFVLYKLIKEYSPFNVKKKGNVSDNGNINTASSEFANTIGAEITDKIRNSDQKLLLEAIFPNGLQADEYGAYPSASKYSSDNIVDIVSTAIANSIPTILHTNKDLSGVDGGSSESWSSWNKAVFGDRNEHAVLLMGGITNNAKTSNEQKGYVLIGDPGSSQVSVNGYNTDPNASKGFGGQLRLVPMDHFFAGLRTYGPNLRHIIPISNLGKGEFGASGGQVSNIANSDIVKNGIAAYNEALGIKSSDSVSSTESAATSFIDYIANLGERLSKVGAAALDWLFTGEFKNPFAGESYTPTSHKNIYDTSVSTTGNINEHYMLNIDSKKIHTLKPTKTEEDIVQRAYGYAMENGISFDLTNNSTALTIALMAAKVMTESGVYMQKFMQVSDGRLKTSLSSEGFVFEVLTRVISQFDPDVIDNLDLYLKYESNATVDKFIKQYAKQKQINVGMIISEVIADNKPTMNDISAGSLSYSGIDLSGYQSFATTYAGYSNVVGNYKSSKMNQQEQRDILKYVRRMTSWSETGQDPDNYSDINKLYYDPIHLAWNNEHSITFGRHGFYADNAAEVMARLANAPISEADKRQAMYYAEAIKNHNVSDAFRNELAAFIRKPSIAPYVKHIEDAMSVQYSDYYLSRILPKYDSGIIKDPRSVMIGAEFAGVAPGNVGYYYENLNTDTSANGELETVARSMKYHYNNGGWQNRINGVLGALQTGKNAHLGSSFELPQSVYNNIPEDASPYTGAVGYGLAETMRNSIRDVPSGSGYGSDDAFMGDEDHPVNVKMDSSPITRRLDAILAWLEELTKEYPEKAGPVSGYGTGAAKSQTPQKRPQSKADKMLGDNDHIINGTAQDKLRRIHNTLAGRTRV